MTRTRALFACVIGGLAGAGCTAPPLNIELAIASGANNTCTAVSNADPQCSDVPLTCQSMVLIRVLDPNNPGAPFISSCEAVVDDAAKDLCSIVTVGIAADKLPKDLPERTLEVQVVVMPFMAGSDGTADCDGAIGSIMFADATGELISEAGQPAIGGRAYYHPGDASTVVYLGCPNLVEVNAAACAGSGTIAIAATVDEFDTQIGVSAATADGLDVRVGEPAPDGIGFSLNLNDAPVLTPSHTTQPSWSGNVGLMFDNAACLAVLDDNAFEATPTLVCTSMVQGKTSLALTGMHVSSELVGQLITTIQKSVPAFTPDQGLVLGVVLDELGNPVSGSVVTPAMPGATVAYLSQDGMSLTTTGTASNGIFVSIDAPFLTSWSSGTAQGFGGLVNGKITVVVLQSSQTHT